MKDVYCALNVISCVVCVCVCLLVKNCESCFSLLREQKHIINYIELTEVYISKAPSSTTSKTVHIPIATA